ncbi:GNAT family N-acetyltransferase [Enterococcus sp. 2201sp1_2201st1_B8_2201SCRN_220225]
MIVTEFDREDPSLKVQLADLLELTWPDAYGGNGAREVDQLLQKDTVAIAALVGDELIGFATALPQYGQTGWKLRIMAVRDSHRKQRIGARLMAFIEEEVASRGGLVMYLGAADNYHQTSLSEEDLFVNPLQSLQEIENVNHHPYEFYQKQGYQLVGVIPDANGWQQPDILMAKRLVKRPADL